MHSSYHGRAVQFKFGSDKRSGALEGTRLGRMPIYEFRCDACAEQFEELLRTRDEARVSCPHCGSTSVTRLFSLFATEWRPSNVAWHNVPGSRAHD